MGMFKERVISKVRLFSHDVACIVRGRCGSRRAGVADKWRDGDCSSCRPRKIGSMVEADADHFSLSDRKLGMQGVDLALEGGDGSDTAVDRVPNPRISLVHEAAHCIGPLFHGHLLRSFSPPRVPQSQLRVLR